MLSGNEMIQILLPIDILAGIIALTSAAPQVSPKKGRKLLSIQVDKPDLLAFKIFI